MLQLDEWLVLWQEAVVNEFGPGRVRFMGIQGSRARGEAHEGSDIDVVLILDELTPDDLVRYRACVAQLPEREKLCGFVSGEEELRRWHQMSGLPLKKFFNTSGMQYRALGLKDRLPQMSEDEQFALLATDGMLVKRPMLIGEDFVLVGFKEAEWAEKV